MFPVLLNKCLLLKYLGLYLVRYTFSFACIFQPMLPDKLNQRRIRWDSKIQFSFFDKVSELNCAEKVPRVHYDLNRYITPLPLKGLM
jgi:hypothetical protein